MCRTQSTNREEPPSLAQNTTLGEMMSHSLIGGIGNLIKEVLA
jgi:hypothetical protein